MVLALLLPTLAIAQGTDMAFGTVSRDPDAPVEVTADHLAVDDNAGSAVFSSNVIVGQGDMRITAPRVEVRYKADGSGIESVVATGGVTLVSGEDAAEGERADYDIETGVIVMRGNVLVTRGLNAISSDTMTVNMDTGRARMEGRVKSVLQREKKK